MNSACKLVAVVAFCCWSIGLVTGFPGAEQLGTMPTSMSYEPTGPMSSSRSIVSEEQREFDRYRSSPLYVAPIEPNMLSVPQKQVLFFRNVCEQDKNFFIQIVNDALKNRYNLFPSMSLLRKYGSKMISILIKHRRDEMKIEPRYEPKSEFFFMAARLSQAALDKSKSIRKVRGYTRNNVDVEEFRARAIDLLSYVQRVLDVSPFGIYIRWDQMRLYMDQPTHKSHGVTLENEMADLLAQFRAIGYSYSISFGHNIVRLLNMFARGKVPESESEVIAAA